MIKLLFYTCVRKFGLMVQSKDGFNVQAIFNLLWSVGHKMETAVETSL
jgi:hypothetical protein